MLAVDDGRKERERRREKRDDRTRARLSNGISINYKVSLAYVLVRLGHVLDFSLSSNNY